MRFRPLAVAVLATLLALSWQALTIRANFDGNWTALICTGGERPFPPQLENEHIYRFPGSYGFDGQLYHYMAHDPFLEKGLARYQDDPGHRYRRLLVPLLAYAAALGNQNRIDVAYFWVTMSFLFLGAWWLAKYARRHGRHPIWGLAFLLLPATLVTIDRLVVDMALAALCVAFALEAEGEPTWRLWVVLAAAPLVRETGLLLVGGYCLWLAARRSWRPMVLAATAGLPWLAWCLFVYSRTELRPYGASVVPLSSIVYVLLHPQQYPSHVPLHWALHVLDYMALAGMLLAFVLTALWLRRGPRTPEAAAAGLFVVLAVFFLQRWEHWVHVYDYCRTLTPLLLLLGLRWFRERRWVVLLPLLMIAPRVAAQFGKQVLGVLGAPYTG